MTDPTSTAEPTNPPADEAPTVLRLTLPGVGSWPLDLNTMLVSEAERCEELTGWEATEWRDALFDNRARAVKFAVFLARARSGEPVSWADLDFDLAALDWTVDGDGGTRPAEPPAPLGVSEDDADVVPTGRGESEPAPEA